MQRLASMGLRHPGLPGAADPSIVEDSDQPITPYFLTPGATNLESNTLIGSSWYVLNTASNGVPQDADLRVLIMQVTTAGSIRAKSTFKSFPSMLERIKINSARPLMVKGPSPLLALAESVQLLQVAPIPALATMMRTPLKTTALVILHLVRDARSSWHATMTQQPQSMTVHATSLHA